LLSGLGGALGFLLNIPLFWRTVLEHTRLRKLGVAAIFDSLWKVSRRGHWLSRIRTYVILFLGFLFVLIVAVFSYFGQEIGFDRSIAPYMALLAALFFAADYLRKRREQMDLAANAGELKKALIQFLARSSATATIAVPTELIEQVATIEAANIALERKTAIAGSADSLSTGFAIQFDERAAVLKAALKVEDRLALEDLLADLSAAPPERATQERITASNGPIQVGYEIDRQSRVIRVDALETITHDTASPVLVRK
jgi:hypothetical protein